MVRHSVSLRIAAFLAVSCAIASVAWASRDPWLLVIGVPGLAAGHFYSWRRREASKVRSLILLLFMVLTVFLGEEILLSGFSDRLLLSRYLIYGLVIGSFDLMRRRNVVASLILGGLLLVLISELALDWWFLVFSLVFTILVLAVLVLTHIEAESSQTVLVGEFRWPGAVRLWSGLTVAILLVSAVFFLLMPRLVSQQLTQSTWLPSRLDLSLGGPATLPSKPGAAVASGILPSLGEGEGSGGGNYAALGYTGSLADTPVMYVRSRISSYWRGLTLDEYDGRGWLVSVPQIERLNRNRPEYALPDSRLASSGDRVYWQVYYLLSDQPNAIFTGYQPGKIYLSQDGQTLLEEGTLYRTLSLVPRLTPDDLRRDRVATDDIASLELPFISEETAALAESIVEGAATDYDQAVRLERFLYTNYPYDLKVEPLPPGWDAVEFFLFEQQAGYCAQFATAMAVMARQVGLPARVAAGYLPGYIDPMTGAHIVRAGDAHAWVEINFRQHGWVAFDPTPRTDASLGFAAGRNLVYFGLEDFVGVTFASMLSPLAGSFSFAPLSVPGWVWVVLPGAGIMLVVLVWLLGRYRPGARKEARGYRTLDGESRKVMLRLYQLMVALMVKKGLPARPAYQPLYEYASTIGRQLASGREAVDWLTRAASRAAYSPEPFDSAAVAEARQKLSALKRALAGRR